MIYVCDGYKESVALGEILYIVAIVSYWYIVRVSISHSIIIRDF